nr:MAG TPA: hypothetical protein [Caudoviricetes sp.]DAJ57293.1 MAG TPA: hypothetical protein [Caudoviricetes sp.]
MLAPLCYGVLAIDPRKQYTYTPEEIIRMWHGYIVREHRRQEFFIQYITLPIMNANGGKQIGKGKSAKYKPFEMIDILGRDEYNRRFGKPKKNKNIGDMESFMNLFDK